MVFLLFTEAILRKLVRFAFHFAFNEFVNMGRRMCERRSGVVVSIELEGVIVVRGLSWWVRERYDGPF